MLALGVETRPESLGGGGRDEEEELIVYWQNSKCSLWS